MQKKKSVYLPGLNGLRFIAAFFVIVAHIELIKGVFGFINYWDRPFISYSGTLSVTLFFVLSGFLITFLLLTEKKNFGDISIRQFYMRRILRIWPLYFLIVLMGFFLFPGIGVLSIPKYTAAIHDNFETKLVLFLAVLPNIAGIVFPPVPYISQTWSIGVEEQFYLIWPILIKYTRKYPLVLFGIIFSLVVITNSLNILLSCFSEQGYHTEILSFLNVLKEYFGSLRISCMAIGGIGAFLLFFQKKSVLDIVYRRDVQLMTLILTTLLIYEGINIPYCNHEFYSILFCIIILNVSSNSHSIVKLERQPFVYLGRISYGLYMYHPLAIVFSLVFLKNLFNEGHERFFFNLSLYCLSISITIGLASLSFLLFETKMLKLKSRFSRVQSGG